MYICIWFIYPRVNGIQAAWFGSGARFSKVPKLFGRILGDIILFVSVKRRCFEARNFFLFLFRLQYMKRLASQNKWVRVLLMAFRTRKVFGTFEKLAPKQTDPSAGKRRQLQMVVRKESLQFLEYSLLLSLIPSPYRHDLNKVRLTSCLLLRWIFSI